MTHAPQNHTETTHTETTHAVFAGLSPRAIEPLAEPRERSVLAKHMLATMPIILAGSMAISINLTGAVESANAKRPLEHKDATASVLGKSPVGKSIREAMATASARITTTAQSAVSLMTTTSAPTTYVVESGDSISDIAGRFGLSTASVLAMNGLSWSSLIFPGQKLRLASATPSSAPVVHAPTEAAPVERYTIVAGDTISSIATRFGVGADTILSVNGLGWSSIIYPGQSLSIPGMQAPQPAPVVDAAPVASVPSTGGGYTIASGDTLSSIAAAHGVSIDALLAANGLQLTSLIFSGEQLIIPGGLALASSSTPIAEAAPVEASSDVLGTGLDATETGHARTIIQVGRDLGVPDYGIVIALATAMQESSMRNLDWGDRDSVGLFQQRPSTGWGAVSDLTTPVHAAHLFYGGPSNPNKGKTLGLLDISGWQDMAVTDAAQAVQISGHPTAYAKWERSAWSWLAELG